MHAMLILAHIYRNVLDNHGFSQKICDTIKLAKEENIYRDRETVYTLYTD